MLEVAAADEREGFVGRPQLARAADATEDVTGAYNAVFKLRLENRQTNVSESLIRPTAKFHHLSPASLEVEERARAREQAGVHSAPRPKTIIRKLPRNLRVVWVSRCRFFR